jgi:TonB family protein
LEEGLVLVRSRPGTWSLALSVVAHVALLGGAGFVAFRSLAAREAREREVVNVAPPADVITIELPTVAEGTLLADKEDVPEGTKPTAYGGATIARVDTGTQGAGGDTMGARATNLAAYAEDLSLNPDLLSHLERDQVQRLRTARLRTTHEDRRATTNPMELTFLASGKGEHQERRPDSPTNPSRGTLSSALPAAVLGGHPGSNADDAEREAGSSAGATQRGQLFAAPGVGARDGEPGADHRNAARIAYGRPAVTQGPVTIPAAFNGRPNDTVDSDQEVASTVRNLVHASVAGGLVGDGRGGSSAAATDPGAGSASGRGSTARALGDGQGDLFDFYTSDPMLLPYFRKLKSKIDPLWVNAFPKSAMLELKQGTVILEFTVSSDGHVKVTWPPTRPSGIDEFDRNCADAIRRAGPFEPIPQALKDRGYTQLRIRAPFEARNPIVK